MLSYASKTGIETIAILVIKPKIKNRRVKSESWSWGKLSVIISRMLEPKAEYPTTENRQIIATIKLTVVCMIHIKS